DDADQRGVTALVLADPAPRAVGEVEAHLAQADPLLDVANRLGQRAGLLVGRAQEVKREPLRRAISDPGQLSQLGDQPLDRRGVDLRHERSPVAYMPGRPRPPRSPVTLPSLLA